MTRAPGPDAAPADARGFVVIQICGCSHAVLERALARGRMPALARLLRRGVHRLHRVPVGLPSSTPAFQAGVMYGGPVDIPGFEFLDKRTGTYRWFPRPWDAAAVEAAHEARGEGIVRGGRTYGSVFGGGAEDTVLTFARLLRSGRGRGRAGLVERARSTLALGGVVLRLSVATAAALAGWVGGVLRDLSLGRRVASLRELATTLAISGWLRELFTRGVTLDLRAGVPALYVTFVDYDVAAHEHGPESRAALRRLRLLDRSVRRIARAARRRGGRGHDLFVLSDHGQVRSVPFGRVAGGASFASVVLDCFGPPTAPVAAEACRAEGAEPPAPRAPWWPWRLGGGWQRSPECLQGPIRERNAVWAGGLCIVPAGPNANIYVTYTTDRVLAEAIEARYPGAIERLSRHPGVGFVLTRDAGGPLCCYRGSVLRIPPPPGPTGCPVFDRPDRDVVVRGLEDLLAMPSGGDVIVYGHYAEAGCVSFLGEIGSHAGPSESELYGFVAAPAGVAFDFGAVTRPRDLHALFARYRRAPASAGPEGA